MNIQYMPQGVVRCCTSFTFGAEAIRMRGKVFEVGEYPEICFNISASEMDAAVQQFLPVEADLEHSGIQTFLGRPLGKLIRIWRTGNDVLGELEVPKWLSDLCRQKLQVSLAFNEMKQVVGCAFTERPRIDGATVQAAFRQSHAEEIGKMIDRAIDSGKLVPAEREAAVTMALAGQPKSTRSNEFLLAFSTWLETRPQQFWLTEQLTSETEEVSVGMSEARRQELLAKSELGVQAARMRQKR